MDNQLLAFYRKKLERAEREREAGRLLGNDTKKLSRRIRLYRKDIKALENINDVMLELKPRTYYTAQVSLSVANPLHFAIIYVEAELDMGIQIFNHTYRDGVAYCDYTELNDLKIIEEIEQVEDVG